MWSSTAKKSSQQHRDGPTWSVSVFYLSAYLTSHDRGPAEVEQGDEHEDRSGPAGQPLLHDGGAQSAQGAELETSEATQLHGGGVTFISTILISILTKVSMKARAAFGSMGSMKIGGSGSSDLLLGSSRSRTGRSSNLLASHKIFQSQLCPVVELQNYTNYQKLCGRNYIFARFKRALDPFHACGQSLI